MTTQPQPLKRTQVAEQIQEGRAQRGAMVLQHYDTDDRGVLTRLLTDLIAFADASGMNFEGAASIARQRVNAVAEEMS
jgi:hypothetical protein